jgi:hypothetical protein
VASSVPTHLPNNDNRGYLTRRILQQVLFDLSEQELCILDRFEDIEYTKLIVSALALVLRGNLW